MPIRKVVDADGREGWQWGEHGTIYYGPDGYDKALRQAKAAHASGYKGKK